MDTQDTFLTLRAIIKKIGTDVAANFADQVDRESRFPRETLQALKEQRLLSACIPTNMGGAGLDIRECAILCGVLGQYCAASAMVLAMHYIQVASIYRHCDGKQHWLVYLKRIVDEQRLIASATSEEGVGGEMRKSICGIEQSENQFHLVKKATTISYGQHADDLLISARRSVDAAGNDQLLVLAEQGDYQLSEHGVWDTLGMRGTCSPGAKVEVTADSWKILPQDFARIAGETMVPYSHILWSALWLGIATDALNRTRDLVRNQAKKQRGETPVAAFELTRLNAELQKSKDGLFATIAEYDAYAKTDVTQLSGIAFSIRINNLKLDTSQQVVSIVSCALQAAGILAFKNGTPFSLGRHLRDAHSAALMIHNQRLVEANASMQLLVRGNSDKQGDF